jgi:HSP20 family protein
MMHGLMQWPETKPEMALGDWAPRMDVVETPDRLITSLEVPGVDQGDIVISLRDGVLTIRGEKRWEKIDDEERCHHVERAFGLFLRSVRLPALVDASRATATFRNGLLTVALPKARTARRATIPIETE